MKRLLLIMAFGFVIMSGSSNIEAMVADDGYHPGNNGHVGIYVEEYCIKGLLYRAFFQGTSLVSVSQVFSINVYDERLMPSKCY